MRKRKRIWIALLAVWILIGLFFSFNDYWFRNKVKAYGQESLGMLLLWDAVYWPTWAALGWLLIFRVARRFPLGRRGWARNLFVIVGFGLGFAFLHRVIYLSIAALIQQKWFDSWLLFYNLPLGFMSYCVILVADYAFSQREEARASREEAEVSRLKADLKLQPHFIYNALNSIATQVRKDPEKADEMIDRLGGFLRLTLDYADVQTVTLTEELGIARSYLAIERIRLEDKLCVDEEIEPLALGALVPTFVLQPSVENAIKHRRSFEQVRIVISARCEGGRLRLQVRDNGDGWRSNGNVQGRGIENTRARLEGVYGSGSRFDLKRDPGGWTAAILEMPFVSHTGHAAADHAS